MSDKVTLRLDWCSYEAAKYAVEHWHYSRVLPAGKLVKIGVWEDGQFIGYVIFGRGANNHIASPYGLEQTKVCELVRIALKEHESPVSKIGAIAISILRKQSPELRLIVSYADPKQSHKGLIYQAMNWIYTGSSQAQRFTLRLDGTIEHKRSAFSRFGTVKGLEKSEMLWKHKYLYPLDSAMRVQILPLAKPYPKRGQGETDNAVQSKRVRSAVGGTPDSNQEAEVRNLPARSNKVKDIGIVK
jgi:hypothetical protein